VQCVWRNGQDYGGIEGVRNKYVKNCGRKKVEIDMEAIKDCLWESAKPSRILPMRSV